MATPLYASLLHGLAYLIAGCQVFYREAGLSVDDAFSLSLGQYALGAVGTMSSWYTMNSKFAPLCISSLS